MSPAVFIVCLALLLGLHPIATNLYLPTLPQLQVEMGASMSQVQMTLSVLAVSFGSGQLVWGSVSDWIGRYPTLIAGLLLFTLASALAALTVDMPMMIVCRGLEGWGMAAAIVCARAMIRDLYAPSQGAHVLSLGLAWMGVIALICPMLGAQIANLAGFRAALWVLTLFGVLTLLFIAICFKETYIRPAVVTSPHMAWYKNWQTILSNKTFLLYAGLTTATYGGLYTFLSASSFIMIDGLHISRLAYSAVLSTSALFYILGTFACRYWLKRHGNIATVRRAGVLSLLGGLLMAGFSITQWHSVWAILLPQCIYVFAHSIHQSCGQAAAIGPFPQSAGTAAALMGFAHTLLSFLIGCGLAVLMDGSVYPLTLSVGFWGLLTAIFALRLIPASLSNAD